MLFGQRLHYRKGIIALPLLMPLARRYMDDV